MRIVCEMFLNVFFFSKGALCILEWICIAINREMCSRCPVKCRGMSLDVWQKLSKVIHWLSDLFAFCREFRFEWHICLIGRTNKLVSHLNQTAADKIQNLNSLALSLSLYFRFLCVMFEQSVSMSPTNGTMVALFVQLCTAFECTNFDAEHCAFKLISFWLYLCC